MKADVKLLKKQKDQENRQFEILEPPYTFQEFISRIIIQKNSDSNFLSWTKNYPLACEVIVR